jgi:hypothetical protein
MQIAAWSEQPKSRRRNKGHVSAAQNRRHAHGSKLIQSHAEAMRRQMGGVEERALECLGRLVAAWGKEAMGLVSWAARRGQLNAQGRTTCVVQGRGRQAGTAGRLAQNRKPGLLPSHWTADRCSVTPRRQFSACCRRRVGVSGRQGRVWRDKERIGAPFVPLQRRAGWGADEWGSGRAPFTRRAAPGRSSAGSVCAGSGGGEGGSDDGGRWVVVRMKWGGG